ncbi:MAG: glycosyltransferase family 2 protein [Gemmatimonadaceae bacterium]
MTAREPVGVTVVIAARNEAANITDCIASVSWAREVVVVENDSTDDTIERARAAGAKVMSNDFETIGRQRNAAIEAASSQWILVVDADERGSPRLGEEVRATIAGAAYYAYRVPRRNFFLGSEVRHGGWNRDRPIRLFRSHLRYDASRVHEHVVVSGDVGELRSTLSHEPYPSINSYLEKLERYSLWWAEDKYERGKRTGPASVWVRSRLRFASMYFLKFGFLDGEAGVILASLASMSVMTKYARLWEIQKRGGQ